MISKLSFLKVKFYPRSPSTQGRLLSKVTISQSHHFSRSPFLPNIVISRGNYLSRSPILLDHPNSGPPSNRVHHSSTIAMHSNTLHHAEECWRMWETFYLQCIGLPFEVESRLVTTVTGGNVLLTILARGRRIRLATQ